MARRRAIASGLQAGSDLIGMYLKDLLDRDRQSQIQRQAADIAREQKALEIANANIGTSPAAAETVSGMTGLSPDVFPSQMTRASGVVGGMQGKGQPDLPTDTGLEALLRQAGVNLDPEFGQMAQPPTPPGVLPSTQFGPVKPGPQQFAERGLAEARGQAEQFAPTTMRSFYSDKENRMMQQGVKQGDPLMTEALPQGPTPTQQGLNELTTAQSGKMSPAWARSQAELENSIALLTRDADRLDAAAAALGQQQGYMNPAMVDARVDEHLRKQLAEVEAGGAGSRPTASELSAAALSSTLAKDHVQALEMEAAGVRLVPGAQVASTSPLGGMFVAPLMRVNDQEKRYATTALSFTANVGKVMSGVQVRPDERDIFIGVMFSMPNDTNAIIEEKRARRTAFIAAGAVMSGRGGYVAGQSFAQQVKSGAFGDPATVGIPFINSLDLSGNPEFQRGLEEELAR